MTRIDAFVHRSFRRDGPGIPVAKWITGGKAFFIQTNIIGRPAVHRDRGYAFAGDPGATAQTFLNARPDGLQIPAQLLALCDWPVGDPVHQSDVGNTLVPT